MTLAQIAYLGNTVLSLTALLILSGIAFAAWAVTVEPRNPERVPLGWRLLIVAVTLQQAALAYGTVDAYRLQAALSLRLLWLALTAVALIVAAVIVVVDGRRNDRWSPTRRALRIPEQRGAQTGTTDPGGQHGNDRERAHRSADQPHHR